MRHSRARLGVVPAGSPNSSSLRTPGTSRLQPELPAGSQFRVAACGLRRMDDRWSSTARFATVRLRSNYSRATSYPVVQNGYRCGEGVPLGQTYLERWRTVSWGVNCAVIAK